MTRTLCAALVALLIAATAQALSYIKLEQVTVGATAVGFTTADITATGHPAAFNATCRLATAEISWTIDGTTPTSTVGTLMSVGDTLVLTGNDVLQNFRAIRTTGTSGKLNCNYSTP